MVFVRYVLIDNIILIGGGGCTAYDVVVHPDFFKKLETSELFRTFFLTVTCEGIEEKFKTELIRG